MNLARGRSLLKEMNRHSQVCAEAILRGGFDLFFAAPCQYYAVPRLSHFLAGRGLPLCLYLQEPMRHRYEAMPELPWLAPLPSAPGVSLFKRLKRVVSDAWYTGVLRRRARLELEDAKRYDRILVNSYFSRESIVRAYGIDARVSYLGCDSTMFRRLEPAPARERFVMGLGSMHSIKGVETAILAMAALPAPRPPLIWVANSQNDAYRREMESLALQHQVDFQIRLRASDEELVSLLNRAALLLYTSRLEPFGYAPVEAHACGVPVVAVAEGGIRETVIDGVNGLLCDRDPRALASAMGRLLGDPALAASLGAAGARRAAGFWSAEEGISRLEEHFAALLR
jgi:glycosyltransferase involved in cell wall biosynthesis